MCEKDYYFCYHNENGEEIIIQKTIPKDQDSPICPKCNKIMTYGRWTSEITSGIICRSPSIKKSVCEQNKGDCQNCQEKYTCQTYINFVAPQIKYAQCEICIGCHQAHTIPKIGFKCKYLTLKINK